MHTKKVTVKLIFGAREESTVEYRSWKKKSRFTSQYMTDTKVVTLLTLIVVVGKKTRKTYVLLFFYRAIC